MLSYILYFLTIYSLYNDQIKKNLPISFHTFFTLKTEQHRHNKRGNSLNIPPVKTTTYDGSMSVTCCVQSETGTSHKT